MVTRANEREAGDMRQERECARQARLERRGVCCCGQCEREREATQALLRELLAEQEARQARSA